MDPATSQIANAIISEIRDCGELKEDMVVSLHRIFQHTFLEALNLIDRGKVIRLVHQNREFIQVTGSNGVHHVFLDLMDVRIDVKDEGNSIDTTVLDPGIATIWCSCETYLTRLLMSVEGQMCEHILAAVLGIRLGTLITRTCDNHEIDLSFLGGS